MKIHFYCRACKANKKGIAPIEMAVTVTENHDSHKSQRKIISLPMRYEVKKFLKDKFSRDYVETIQSQVNAIYLELLKRGKTPTTDLVIDIFRNGWADNKAYTLADLWDEYNELLDLKDAAGEMTLRNREKYTNAVKAFFEVVDKNKPLSELKRSDIEKLSLSLKLRGLKDVSVSGYLGKLKTIMLYAFNNGKIDHNPFYGIKIVKSSPETIKYLTEEEIERIKNHTFNDRLTKVKDLFLFGCFTGLSYTDMVHFSIDDIKEAQNGQKWLKKGRGKTGIYYTVPILPQAEEILVKYDGKLPILSNAKMNEYLKEIQHICDIKTNLSCHKARHTFACLLIQKGLPLEVIAKALGHSNTNTTKIYAKLLDKTVVETIRNAFTKMAG